MIVLLPEPFCSKIIVMFLCDSLNDIFDHQEDFRHRARYQRLKLKYFRESKSSSRRLQTPQLPGGVLQQLVFLILSVILKITQMMVSSLNLTKIRNEDTHYGTKGIWCFYPELATQPLHSLNIHNHATTYFLSQSVWVVLFFIFLRVFQLR